MLFIVCQSKARLMDLCTCLRAGRNEKVTEITADEATMAYGVEHHAVARGEDVLHTRNARPNVYLNEPEISHRLRKQLRRLDSICHRCCHLWPSAFVRVYNGSDNCHGRTSKP